MTKSMARNREAALKDFDASLSRMKTDYVDLWQLHSLESPQDWKIGIKNGVLDAFLEAQKQGKARHLGFTGHSSYKAHLKMLEELQRLGLKMASLQMPVNPADPHYEQLRHPRVARVRGAWHRRAGHENTGRRTFLRRQQGLGSHARLGKADSAGSSSSVEDVFGFVWSLPITTLVSGMESVQQVSQNAAIARKTWNWDQAERQKRIDAVAPIACPHLEFSSRILTSSLRVA